MISGKRESVRQQHSMKIDEQWGCWTLCAIKIKARTGGEKERHLWPRLVQLVAEGNELSWKVKVMIKKWKRKESASVSREGKKHSNHVMLSPHDTAWLSSVLNLFCDTQHYAFPQNPLSHLSLAHLPCLRRLAWCRSLNYLTTTHPLRFTQTGRVETRWLRSPLSSNPVLFRTRRVCTAVLYQAQYV